jgi:hypothetical protein
MTVDDEWQQQQQSSSAAVEFADCLMAFLFTAPQLTLLQALWRNQRGKNR